jgi:gas vesicle protein
MQFAIGLLLGFGVGFAGAILFAPEGKRRETRWPQGHPGSALSANGRRTGALRDMLRTLQEHVNEAWGEARKAQQEAEREMEQRYREQVTARRERA